MKEDEDESETGQRCLHSPTLTTPAADLFTLSPRLLLLVIPLFSPLPIFPKEPSRQPWTTIHRPHAAQDAPDAAGKYFRRI